MKLRRLEIIRDNVEEAYFPALPPSGVLVVQGEAIFKGALKTANYTITGVETLDETDQVGEIPSSAYVKALQSRIETLEVMLENTNERVYRVSDDGDFKTVTACLASLKALPKRVQHVIIEIFSPTGLHGENIEITALPSWITLTLRSVEKTALTAESACDKGALIATHVPNAITLQIDLHCNQKAPLNTALYATNKEAKVTYEGVILGSRDRDEGNFTHGIYCDDIASFCFKGDVIGCGVETESLDLYGGGIYLDTVAYATLKGTIKECYVGSKSGGGAGLYAKGCDQVFFEGVIKECETTGNGGGLYLDQSTLWMQGEITTCHATNGGGVYNTKGSLTLTGSIKACEASTGGGGIYLAIEGYCEVSGMLYQCRALYGGGYAQASSVGVMIIGKTFRCEPENIILNAFFRIGPHGQYPTINECLKVINQSNGGASAMLYVEGDAGVHAENVVIDQLPENISLYIVADKETCFTPKNVEFDTNTFEIRVPNRVMLQGDIINNVGTLARTAIRIDHKDAHVEYRGVIRGSGDGLMPKNYLHGINQLGGHFKMEGEIIGCGFIFLDEDDNDDDIYGYGGGIYSEESLSLIFKGAIRNCMSYAGGGIATIFVEKVEFEGEIENCTGISMCGGAAFSDSTVHFNGEIRECKTDYNRDFGVCTIAGGMGVRNTHLVMYGGITGCEAGSVGGFYSTESVATVHGSVEGCSSLGYAGGVVVEGGEFHLTGLIKNCTSQSGVGGMEVLDNSVVNVHGIEACSSEEHICGVSAEGGETTIRLPFKNMKDVCHDRLYCVNEEATLTIDGELISRKDATC